MKYTKNIIKKIDIIGAKSTGTAPLKYDNFDEFDCLEISPMFLSL